MLLTSHKHKALPFFLSLLFHFFILIIISRIQYWTLNDYDYKSNYLSINIKDYLQSEFEDKNLVKNEEVIKNFPLDDSKKDDVSNLNSFFMYDSLIQAVDSTQLDSIYRDDSRGIYIKFPLGWTFLDQKVDTKFDGVTFWPNNISSENAPYVHLEVAEKELFTERRYQFKVEHSDFTWYYNSPEVLDEFVDFEIYIKTQKDVDYKIKLIINGEANFKSFHPKFLAMLKSLRFKDEFFDIF